MVSPPRCVMGCSWGDDMIDIYGSDLLSGAAPIYEGEVFFNPHTFIGFRPLRRRPCQVTA